MVWYRKRKIFRNEEILLENEVFLGSGPRSLPMCSGNQIFFGFSYERPFLCYNTGLDCENNDGARLVFRKNEKKVT
jgi:hypothetical protein